MKVKRDWFSTAALFVYELIIFFALALFLNRIGQGQTYPYAPWAQWMLSSAAVIGLLILFSFLWARMELGRRLGKFQKVNAALEWLIGGLLFSSGVLLRIAAIVQNPVLPAGDFNTFFEIGRLMSLGSLDLLSPFYCDYIALFPSTMGYAKLLSMLFGVTGISVAAAQYMNLALQAAGLFLVWRIARALSGRIGGLAALAAVSFWPSMILYSGFVASEFAYTFFILLAVWLVIAQEKRPLERVRSFRHFFLLVAAGVALGFAMNQYPQTFLLVIALGIYYRRCERTLPALPLNELPLGHRAVSKGWKCFLILLSAFLFTVGISRFSISYEIDRPLAGPLSSMGYSLMTGLNQESGGAWNQEDAAFLEEKQAETASAVETQLRCIDIAKERLNAPQMVLSNLFMQKLDQLLGRDEYAVSLSVFLRGEEGTLTEESQERLYQLTNLSNFFYALLLVLAGAGGILAFTHRPSFARVLILAFDGIVISSLLLEIQNRYHYVLLPLLAVMSGVAVWETMRLCTGRVLAAKLEKERMKQEEESRRRRIVERETQENELNRLRAQALHTQFDMGKAIQEGHIRVIASQAMGGGVLPPADEPADGKAPEANAQKPQ